MTSDSKGCSWSLERNPSFTASRNVMNSCVASRISTPLVFDVGGANEEGVGAVPAGCSIVMETPLRRRSVARGTSSLIFPELTKRRNLLQGSFMERTYIPLCLELFYTAKLPRNRLVC